MSSVFAVLALDPAAAPAEFSVVTASDPAQALAIAGAGYVAVGRPAVQLVALFGRADLEAVLAAVTAAELAAPPA